MAGSILEGLVSRIAARLEGFSEPEGSSDDEPRGAWRKEGLAALASLDGRAMLGALDSEGRRLVDSLLMVAEGAIWPPFLVTPGQGKLLGDLLRNLDAPGRINQGWKGTCAATCVEGWLCEKDPAEYARLLAGLVSMEGRVLLRSGDPLIRDEDVLAPSVTEHHRSPISRIFQAACMEFADGDLDYDNMRDGHFDGDRNLGSGLEMGPFEALLRAISGKPWKTLSDQQAAVSQLMAKLGLDTSEIADLRRDAISIIEQSIEKGEQLFATIELARVRNPIPGATNEAVLHAAHKIRVVGVESSPGLVIYDDPMDPDKPWFDGATVTVLDKRGRCSMAIEDFRQILTELHYLPEVWQKKGPVV